MQYFVRSGALIGFPELVRRYDENPSELLRSVELSTAVLHDPDLYIPYLSLAKLLEAAAVACEAPDFGIQLGYRQGLEAVGALGSVLCLQPSVGDALVMLQKNLGFHARGVAIDVQAEGEHIDLSMRFAFADQIACDQLSALSMMLMARGIEQLHGQSEKPQQLWLAFADHRIQTLCERRFGCPVLLGQTENRLRYRIAGLAEPTAVAPELRARLSKHWRGDWQQSLDVSLSQQVERAITALLPTGECNLPTVARIVQMHPRSLQMRLKQDQSSFGLLLQNTRLRLACQHLQNSDIDLTTLAMNLGFAELAVFSRSFKQWTGQSPRAWRKTAGTASSIV